MNSPPNKRQKSESDDDPDYYESDNDEDMGVTAEPPKQKKGGKQKGRKPGTRDYNYTGMPQLRHILTAFAVLLDCMQKVLPCGAEEGKKVETLYLEKTGVRVASGRPALISACAGHA